MGICHAGRSSADLAALLQADDAGSAPVSFSYAAGDVLDAVPHGIDKGTGLVRACDLIGLDPARAVGFGDALNDLPMFGVLGCAVAMANAQGEVRARADTTTGSADDDGFAAHLARIGLVSSRVALAPPKERHRRIARRARIGSVAVWLRLWCTGGGNHSAGAAVRFPKRSTRRS
jgi:hypothetical protein